MESLKKEIQSVVDIYKSGNLSKAEKLTKNLITNNPRIAFLYNLMGLILTRKNQIDHAIEFYHKGLEIDPNFAMIYNNLGLIYKSRNNFDKAEGYYRKCLSINENTIEAHNNLGNLYIDLNKHDDAIKCFKKSINVNRKFYISHYNLGITYKSTGNFADSEKHLRESIKLNPKLYTAHRALSQIKKYKKGDDHIKVLEDLYKDKSIKKNARIDLSFALGKVCDDIEDFSRASKYYLEGNKLRRKTLSFSKTKERREFSEIKKLFNKDFIKRNASTSRLDILPIFIVGMPRSGTTLVEQILSSHQNVYGGDEIRFFNDLIKNSFYEKNIFSSKKTNKTFKNKSNYIRSSYVDEIKKMTKNERIITDKLPINFKWIGFINLIFPDSKIVHCVRNSKDNCLSIYKNLFTNTELNYAYDFSDLIEFYNLYLDLMKFWKKTLPNLLIEVEYEKLIKEPDSEIKKLIKSCNLVWDDNCLKFYENKRPIKTASDIQARSKIYNSSINSWKKYENYLKKYFKKL